MSKLRPFCMPKWGIEMTEARLPNGWSAKVTG